jgi:hypothetical protein
MADVTPVQNENCQTGSLNTCATFNDQITPKKPQFATFRPVARQIHLNNRLDENV